MQQTDSWQKPHDVVFYMYSILDVPMRNCNSFYSQLFWLFLTHAANSSLWHDLDIVRNSIVTPPDNSLGNLVLCVESVCWSSSRFESALSKTSIDIVLFLRQSLIEGAKCRDIVLFFLLFYNPIEAELHSVSPGSTNTAYLLMVFPVLLSSFSSSSSLSIWPQYSSHFFLFFLNPQYLSPHPFLSFLSFHLISVIFFPLYSPAFSHHLSPFTEGLCASFASLCCSQAFISAAGAPLAGCQSLLAQKPAHSSNTIHWTCIRTQPIVTARPSDWNHPISFLKYLGVNSMNVSFTNQLQSTQYLLSTLLV